MTEKTPGELLEFQAKMLVKIHEELDVIRQQTAHQQKSLNNISTFATIIGILMLLSACAGFFVAFLGIP